MKELIARFRTESPIIFKRLQAFILSVIAIAGTILTAHAADAIPDGIVIPEKVITACTWVVFIGPILFGGAKYPVKDKQVLEAKMSKKK